jgi:hypothetical protein
LAIVKDHLQPRRWQIVTAVVMLICFVALLIPHTACAGSLLACVLFFPVFLFGLLDPPQWLRVVCFEGASLLTEPVRRTLFQRPPPTIE